MCRVANRVTSSYRVYSNAFLEGRTNSEPDDERSSQPTDVSQLFTLLQVVLLCKGAPACETVHSRPCTAKGADDDSPVGMCHKLAAVVA